MNLSHNAPFPTALLPFYDLARTHVSYYNDDAKRIKGMYR